MPVCCSTNIVSNRSRRGRAQPPFGDPGDVERHRKRLGQALETDAAWTAFAPRLENSGLSALELMQVVEEAKRMLDRPELDPGARRKLEIHVRVRDPARQQGLYRDIGPGGGISM